MLGTEELVQGLRSVAQSTGKKRQTCPSQGAHFSTHKTRRNNAQVAVFLAISLVFCCSLFESWIIVTTCAAMSRGFSGIHGLINLDF